MEREAISLVVLYGGAAGGEGGSGDGPFLALEGGPLLQGTLRGRPKRGVCPAPFVGVRRGRRGDACKSAAGKRGFASHRKSTENNDKIDTHTHTHEQSTHVRDIKRTNSK